jgi:hypothetical protein
MCNFHKLLDAPDLWVTSSRWGEGEKAGTYGKGYRGAGKNLAGAMA